MRRSLAVPTLLLTLLAGPLTAQGGATPRTWTAASRFEVTAEYDGNVFLLPTNRLDGLSSPSVSNLQSGRYNLMRSASDLVGTARATVEFERAGLDGRPLILAPGLRYEFFAQNAERRNLAASLTLSQDLRRDGRVRLRAGYRPNYFARNYLTDAVDANADGSITSDERRYARGDYRQFDAEVDYRLRLVKSRRASPFGAFIAFALGYEDRTFDAPFAARNYGGPTAGLRLDLSPRRTVEFQTSYDVALLSSPVTSQVILLDEPTFGEDFNANGNSSDLNARAVQNVDRSRIEHIIAQVARFDIGPVSDLELRVAYRMRQFTSSEPFDVANNGRRDRRLQVGAEYRRRLTKGLRLISGVRYGTQQLNRRTDLGAEGAVDDYSKLQVDLGLRLTP